MKLEAYSDFFKNLLLHDVIIKYNNKILKTGKIKNFDIKQFYIKLYIENIKGKIKILELPYPFDITQTKQKTILNYRIATFCGGNNEMFFRIKLLQKSVSKLYDNLLEIIPIKK